MFLFNISCRNAFCVWSVTCVSSVQLVHPSLIFSYLWELTIKIRHLQEQLFKDSYLKNYTGQFTGLSVSDALCWNHKMAAQTVFLC